MGFGFGADLRAGAFLAGAFFMAGFLAGALMVHEGNLIRAQDTTPLVVINQVTPIYVSFAIPEARLPELKRFMALGTLAVEAKPPNEAEASSHGHITFVDNNVDQTTGTIKVKATFENNDRRLWPGQFVNVNVALTKDPTAVVVPTASTSDRTTMPRRSSRPRTMSGTSTSPMTV